MNNLHLICNAHIDPVWLWEREEGAAAAISTFRVAAEFCEDFNGFVFNHNEVTLYKWVEEYEPQLFKRIQRLVKEGKWHIMGGWYLQPDCNMPSGESFVRQILLGRKYFKEKFGVEPKTAINFDPFGHSRGLIQIMRKSGYDSYIICRPGDADCPLPSDDFLWVGFDGSKVMVHRSDGYNSPLGKAHEKINGWIESNKEKQVGVLLWGVGNHGGGASRIDLNNIKKLIEESKTFNIIHSTPEQYFKELSKSIIELPEVKKDLNAWAVGCYTSQIRIKQKHRLLENELYMLEKMMSSAAAQNYLEYPHEEIHEALCDLMVSEFHDVLPGSSIQPVEETSIRMMDHGLEIISKLKARAIFALSSGEVKAKNGQIPILIYNPHPYKIKGIFECEFQLADQNWKEEFSMPLVYQRDIRISSQCEKELSNLNLDWRKRVVFEAELQPSQMNRFDCKIQIIPKKPQPVLKEENKRILFETRELKIVINCDTGLIDSYRVNGKEYFKCNAMKALVIEDNDDTWGMNVNSFRKVIGEFKLLSKEEGTEFSGVKDVILDSVRVIEDGEVRTVVEAVFRYHNSYIWQVYKLPKNGTEIEIQLRVQWSEKSKMLKLSVPTLFEGAKYIGQVAYGTQELPMNGKESVSQKWTAVVSKENNVVLTYINNGIYGSDYKDGELRISLLRSPAYSGHPINKRPIVVQDRFSPRIDQGERLYTFWFNGGEYKERLSSVDNEAQYHNEKPFALSFFPSGLGKKPQPFIKLSNTTVQLSALKRCEDGAAYIIRIFETTGESTSTQISIPYLDMNEYIEIGAFEIKTLKLDLVVRSLVEVDLMENSL